MHALLPTGRVGAYLHIPFCLRRCPYCDFTVAVLHRVPEEAFAARLLEELEARRDALHGRTLQTIYLGGGTPSLLSPETLGRLIRGVVDAAGTVASDLEVTVEVNPESVSEGWAEALAATGVNRVSLGAQSLDDAVLKQLGREHSGADVRAAVERLAAASIRHISVDLIYGAPGSSPARFLEELRAVARWPEVDHLSAYELTFEPRTAFTVARDRGRLTAWDEESLAGCFDESEALLAGEGFERYEISNFARPDGRSRHNSAYWGGDDYLGLGPGAHSLTVDGAAGVAVRRANGRSTRRYLEGGEVAFESETLDAETHLRELLMLACRRVAPLDLDALRRRSDLTDRVLSPHLRRWVERGLCRVVGDSAHFTPEARRLADSLAAELF